MWVILGYISRFMGPLVSADGSVVGALVVSKDINKRGWKFELNELNETL